MAEGAEEATPEGTSAPAADPDSAGTDRGKPAGRDELATAQAELDAARRELTDAQAAAEDARAEAAENARDLETARTDLETARAEFASARDEVEALRPNADIGAAVATLSTKIAELTRLRTHDADLVDRLHAENTRLRTGEYAAAMAPLLTGLTRLHDQMTSLAGGDQHSVAGMLQRQLLQVLDTAVGVTSFIADDNETFDTKRHTGIGHMPTTDTAADGTVARTVRPGFLRSDGTVLRVAEVEVYHLTHAPTPPPTAG